MNFDGAWRAAAKSATSELVSNGISVTVNTTGSQPCEAPDDLLSAEAEGLLRRSGAVVRPTVLAGAEVTIRVVSLPDGLRCVSSVYMALTIDRLQNVGSDLSGNTGGRFASIAAATAFGATLRQLAADMVAHYDEASTRYRVLYTNARSRRERAFRSA